MKAPVPAPEREDFSQRTWSQNGEDIILRRLFPKSMKGFYVDAGAHHPQRYSNTHYLHAHRGWTGINIDAVAENIAEFERARPNDVNITAFLSDEPDQDVVFKNFAGGLGSTGVAIERISAHRRHRILSEETMVTRTLESILEEHAGSRKIDLLDLDIEGFDYQVLRSLDFSRRPIDVVCVEDFSFQLGTPSPVSELMLSQGFRRISHCYDTSIFVSREFLEAREATRTA